MEPYLQLAQVLAILGGVILSVWKISQSLREGVESRRIEAAKPFLQMRLERYRETIEIAGILATPKGREPQEIAIAEKRFWSLYWAELSMVESEEVSLAMRKLARIIDPDLEKNSQQLATYELAHALRASLEDNWGLPPSATNPP